MLYRLGTGLIAVGVSLILVFYGLLMTVISLLVLTLCPFWRSKKHHQIMCWLAEQLPEVPPAGAVRSGGGGE